MRICAWCYTICSPLKQQQFSNMPDEETTADEIVVSGKALQMAEGWVQNMIGEADSDVESDEDGSTAEFEARPPRLGLGAKYLPHSQMASAMSPVERKLRAMTNAGKHQNEQLRVSSHSRPVPTPTDLLKDGNSGPESSEEEEVKGSSRIPNGRQQRRIGAADLLQGTSRASNNKGKKRKR